VSEPARPLGIVDMDVAPVAASTALDSLRADFAAETDEDVVTFPVRSRRHKAKYEVRFSTRIPYEDLAAWRKRSEDKTMPNDLNETRLACIVLANTCRGIIRNGEEILTEGEPMTFASPAFHALVGADRAVDAVRRFYDRDPDVNRAAGEVLAAAGWAGGEIDETDPTGL
jgi:hypothetical protein